MCAHKTYSLFKVKNSYRLYVYKWLTISMTKRSQGRIKGQGHPVCRGPKVKVTIKFCVTVNT